MSLPVFNALSMVCTVVDVHIHTLYLSTSVSTRDAVSHLGKGVKSCSKISSLCRHSIVHVHLCLPIPQRVCLYMNIFCCVV